MLIICVILAVVAGFFLMVPLAWVFETMHWPEFHKWGLAHGNWIIAWPILTLASLPCIVMIARRLRSGRR